MSRKQSREMVYKNKQLQTEFELKYMSSTERISIWNNFSYENASSDVFFYSTWWLGGEGVVCTWGCLTKEGGRKQKREPKRCDLNPQSCVWFRETWGNATINFTFEIDCIGSDANTTAIQVMHKWNLLALLLDLCFWSFCWWPSFSRVCPGYYSLWWILQSDLCFSRPMAMKMKGIWEISQNICMTSMKNGNPNALIAILICLLYLVLIAFWPYLFEWALKFHILFTWKFSVLTLS